MLKSLAVLSLLLTTAATPVLAGEAADAVKYFYDNLGGEFAPGHRHRYTGPALEYLTAADAAWERDETNCVSFSFAVDGQDFDEVELASTLKLDEVISGDTATVTASFVNFGQPTQVEWTLKNSGNGWLVSDIASLANDWRVSQMSCE